MMGGMEWVLAVVVAGVVVLACALAWFGWPRRVERPVPRVGKVVVHTRDEHSIEGLLVGEDDAWVRLERARLVGDDVEPVALAGSVRVPQVNVRFVQEV